MAALKKSWQLLLVLLLASICVAKLLPTPCEAQVEGKMVFAHYMLYSFLYSDDVAGFTREITLAKKYGIDGFALNTGVWGNIYQTRADYLYQAAAANDFKLFFSADMTISLTLDNIKTMLTRYANYSSQLTYNGKQFISTFAGGNVSFPPYADVLSTWRDGIFAAAGGSYYFVPFFETDASQSDLSYVLTHFAPILSGLLAWELSAWPYVGNSGPVSDAADKAYISSCSAAGNIYMASISPWFYKNTTFIKGNYAGDALWRTHWQQLISLQPNLIEIVTWNDWVERSYVVPIPSDNTPYNMLDYNDAGYPHLAYLDLAGRYFIPWYKTGQKPAINSASQEAIYIFYYKQSKAGSSINNSNVLDDKVYVTVLLYQPADAVIIKSGSLSTTFPSVPAGLQNLTMDFSPGMQSAAVNRSGVTILNVTGNLIIESPGSGQYDFNVYSTYATAS